MKKSRILPALLLLGWIAGILLPLYSLRRLSPSFQTAFDLVFQTDASHVVMHSFLYAVLACIIACMLNKPTWSTVHLLASVMAVIVAVAVSQEVIQMTCEHVVFGADEIFDFFVDLNGGMLGTMIFLRISRNMEKKSGQTGRLEEVHAPTGL